MAALPIIVFIQLIRILFGQHNYILRHFDKNVPTFGIILISNITFIMKNNVFWIHKSSTVSTWMFSRYQTIHWKHQLPRLNYNVKIYTAKYETEIIVMENKWRNQITWCVFCSNQVLYLAGRFIWFSALSKVK